MTGLVYLSTRGTNIVNRAVLRKLKILNHATETGNVSKTCRYFGISRETLYQWKRAFDTHGEQGLINKRPGFPPGSCPWKISDAIEEKIVYLCKTYHFGTQRIAWYMERFHDIRITSAGAYYVLKRNGMNKLPENQRKR